MKKWLKYTDRSYYQIKQSILDVITNDVPELTDHSEGNDFVKMISIWSGIAEMLGYYIDARARETFLTNAIKFESGVKTARLFNYRVRGAIPSVGKVKFILSEPANDDISFPAGTKVKTDDNIVFLTTESVILQSGTTEVMAMVKQWEERTIDPVTSSGSKNQVIILEEGVSDSGIIVKVDGVQWGFVDTFAKAYKRGIQAMGCFDITDGTVGAGNEITDITVDGVSIIGSAVAFDTDKATTASNVADAINNYNSNPEYTSVALDNKVMIVAVEAGADANDRVVSVTTGGDVAVSNLSNLSGGEDKDNYEVFRPFVDEEGKMTVEFGDGVTGAIPLGGNDIDISYYVTKGLAGNVGPGQIDEVVDSITVPNGSLSVTNPNRTNGGQNQEDLIALKRNIPISLRTQHRAVTTQDFIDIACLSPGVHNAAVNFDSGKIVTVYVLPYGGGIATDPLKEQAETYFEDKNIITTEVNVKAVGEVRLLLGLTIYALSGYDPQSVKSAVEENILELLSWKNATIKSRLLISDVYEVIENTEGVKNSLISNITIKPYAEPINQTDTRLNWSRQIIDAGEKKKVWRIQMTSSGAYNLFRDNYFVGNYNLDEQVTLEEIQFTVTAATDSYVSGDAWLFRTYPQSDLNAGKIELDEYSVITSYAGDLTISVK